MVTRVSNCAAIRDKLALFAGIAAISLAPARRRLFIREAKTGWASVGLAPITRITSVLSTDLKSCVPAEVPKVLPRP